jgi:DNA-binding MurR/RpiR family transcriptional regulator
MRATRSEGKREDLFKHRLEIHGKSLTPAGRRVVEFIDQNRGAALASSAMELAIRSGTSDATVVRVVQTLGFEGLRELKLELAASVDAPATPADNMRRTLEEIGTDSGHVVDAVLKTHEEGLSALRGAASKKRIIAAINMLHSADRIVLFGIGPTGAIASYISVLLERSGRRSKVLNATGWMLADQLLDLHKGDSLLVIAYDRAYPEVMATFSQAKRLGLPVVLITDNKESELTRFADVVVPTQRGRAERVALHSTTVACLEAVVLGLSAANRQEATSTLDRLNDLRQLVTKRS